MKMIIPVLALLAISTAAHATPAVGDQAAFQGTWGSDPIWQGLSFTDYNSSTQQFKKVTVTKIGDAAPSQSEEMVNLQDTASDSALQYIVSNCAAQYGTPETVSSPAGTFATCKMPLDQGGFVWVGQVPFAVVRIETPVNGKTLSAVLSGYTRGQ